MNPLRLVSLATDAFVQRVVGELANHALIEILKAQTGDKESKLNAFWKSIEGRDPNLDKSQVMKLTNGMINLFFRGVSTTVFAAGLGINGIGRRIPGGGWGFENLRGKSLELESIPIAPGGRTLRETFIPARTPIPVDITLPNGRLVPAGTTFPIDQVLPRFSRFNTTIPTVYHRGLFSIRRPTFVPTPLPMWI